MPLGDFAWRRLPCSHRSSMAMPLIRCLDHSVTESALSGCLSASRPHTHGSFRRCRIRSRYARFDARSSIKPSVLVTLGGIDAASPMAHSSTMSILARRPRLQRAGPIPIATLSSRPNGSKPHFARSPSVQPTAWPSIPSSSLRPLGESFHRLQRLAHPRTPMAMGSSAPSASAPND